LVAGVAGGFALRKAIMSQRLSTAEGRATRLVAEAEAEAETKVRSALGEVKEESSAMRREAEEDIRLRRHEVKKLEELLAKREDEAAAKLEEVRSREKKVELATGEAERLREELSGSVADQRRELERVSRLTAQEAREALMAQVVDEAKRDAMASVREIEQRAREEGEKRARKIVTIAIQRVASEQ